MKTYFTNCVNSDGNSINNMTGSAKEITRKTFLTYVDKMSIKEIETSLGYSKDFRMSNDWCVRYFKSKYRGKPCVYFDHSSIEYIFV